MLKNHLLVSLRHFRKHPGYTALTVLGLALGMTVCLLILTFVWEQMSYDRFHTHADRIVRVLSERTDAETGEGSGWLAATPAPLAQAVAQEVPGVEASVRLGQIRSRVLRGGGTVELTGLYAEPSFFDVFDFEASGDPRAALATPNQLLLSAEAATALFGGANPVGQTVTLEGQGDFLIAGLLAPPSGPSHLKFDVLASFATLGASERGAEIEDWNNSWSFATYFLLDEAASADRLTSVLPAISERVYAGSEERLAFRVQPLDAIALGPVVGNEISSYSVPALLVYFLAALGFVVMLTAGFNYVGLSTARAVRRTAEVGTRKALGAGRGQIAGQFLVEAILVALLALVVAYGVLLGLVPAFNDLTFVQQLDAQLDAAHLFDLRLLGLFASFSVLVGLVAGAYPALRLARFDPMKALRGHGSRGFSGRWVRHGLIGAQFALALFFVTTTALLAAQARHLLAADYGFRQDDVLSLRLQGQDIEMLRNELLRYPEIRGVAATSKLPASGSTARVALQRAGDEPVATFAYAADPQFLSTLDLDLIAGRTFDERATDTTRSVLLNEAAVRALGLRTPTDALGAPLAMGDDERPVEVVGVVRDYHYNVLIEGIGPLVLYSTPADFRYALIRTAPGEREAAAAYIEALWPTLDPSRPVDLARFDRQLAAGPLNQIMTAFLRVVGLIAGLAVAISLLGLLGMAAYHVETHVKEVGVRKVLGARRRDVVLLLSRSFVRIVAAASLVATPLAWLAGRGWLHAFAVRIEPSAGLLAACAVGMALLAFGVVASQTLRAANADPVRSLRTE